MSEHDKTKELNIPSRLTDPSWLFLEEHNRIMQFIGFISQLAFTSDDVQKIAVKTLYELEDPEKCKKPHPDGDT